MHLCLSSRITYSVGRLSEYFHRSKCKLMVYGKQLTVVSFRSEAYVQSTKVDPAIKWMTDFKDQFD